MRNDGTKQAILLDQSGTFSKSFARIGFGLFQLASISRRPEPQCLRVRNTYDCNESVPLARQCYAPRYIGLSVRQDVGKWNAASVARKHSHPCAVLIGSFQSKT